MIFTHCSSAEGAYQIHDFTSQGVVELDPFSVNYFLGQRPPHHGFRLEDASNDELWERFMEPLVNFVRAISASMSEFSDVLIHCVWGFNRSPALAMAVIMYHTGLSADQARHLD